MTVVMHCLPRYRHSLKLVPVFDRTRFSDRFLLNLPVTGRIRTSHVGAELEQPGVNGVHHRQNCYDWQALLAVLFASTGLFLERFPGSDAVVDPAGEMAGFASSPGSEELSLAA